VRAFSMRHEFPNDWHRFFHPADDARRSHTKAPRRQLSRAKLGFVAGSQEGMTVSLGAIISGRGFFVAFGKLSS
jgi:hypothetical protein